MPEIHNTPITYNLFEMLHDLDNSHGPQIVLDSLEVMGNMLLKIESDITTAVENGDMSEKDGASYDAPSLLIACFAAYMKAMLVEKTNRPSLCGFHKELSEAVQIPVDTGVLDDPIHQA
jgi:hypothetical protein